MAKEMHCPHCDVELEANNYPEVDQCGVTIYFDCPECERQYSLNQDIDYWDQLKEKKQAHEKATREQASSSNQDRESGEPHNL